MVGTVQEGLVGIVQEDLVGTGQEILKDSDSLGMGRKWWVCKDSPRNCNILSFTPDPKGVLDTKEDLKINIAQNIEEN